MSKKNLPLYPYIISLGKALNVKKCGFSQNCNFCEKPLIFPIAARIYVGGDTQNDAAKKKIHMCRNAERRSSCARFCSKEECT